MVGPERPRPPLWGVLLLCACSQDPSATPTLCRDEVCDGGDNDCDGAVDEGVAGYYHPDEDGDGFGAYAGVVSCEAPAGWIDEGGDCDDDAAAVNPGAEEICEGSDDDCDGAIDEGALLLWYADQDTDGYGDPAVPLAACTAPTGFVGSPTDCDDTAAAIGPNSVESCDAVDQDCDGIVDESQSLPSGWVYSLCAPELPVAAVLSDQSLQPGVAALGWGALGPAVTEREDAEGQNDLIATAQTFTVLRGPVRVGGTLSSTGYAEGQYQGDLDNFRFQAPGDGQLTAVLTAASTSTAVELLLYDERSEVYDGPVSAGTPLTRTVAAGAPYVLTASGRSGPPSAYEIHLSFDPGETARYSLWPTVGSLLRGSGIWTAVSADGLVWEPTAAVALDAASCPSDDVIGTSQPAVVLVEGIYHLYFRAEHSLGATTLGLATSADGISWQCEGGRVLTPEGDLEAGGLGFPSVVATPDGTRWMWYAHGPACSQTLCPFTAISLATSVDGITWTRVPGAGIGQEELPAWAEGGLQGHHVQSGPDGWVMYFSGDGGRTTAAIGRASSEDGWSWQVAEEPVLSPGEGAALNPARLLSPTLVYDEALDRTLLWYVGEQPLTRLGLAWRSGRP